MIIFFARRAEAHSRFSLLLARVCRPAAFALCVHKRVCVCVYDGGGCLDPAAKGRLECAVASSPPAHSAHKVFGVAKTRYSKPAIAHDTNPQVHTKRAECLIRASHKQKRSCWRTLLRACAAREILLRHLAAHLSLVRARSAAAALPRCPSCSSGCRDHGAWRSTRPRQVCFLLFLVGRTRRRRRRRDQTHSLSLSHCPLP
jgi:hypothetical protein